MVVDQSSFIQERPFLAKKLLLSQNFRELHVYLLQGPCWATMPLMKIHSSPAIIITDHFLIAL